MLMDSTFTSMMKTIYSIITSHIHPGTFIAASMKHLQGPFIYLKEGGGFGVKIFFSLRSNNNVLSHKVLTEYVLLPMSEIEIP